MADAHYKALLIGNSTFPSDNQNLPDLDGPVNDVAVLRDALTDDESGLFEPQKVRLVSERTSPEILMELERFFGSAKRDDTLLLYYSGHGLLNERNQLLLCARDTRTDLLKSTSISSSAINAMFDDSAAQTTIIVLDCCHSGAFKGGNLASDLRGTGRYLLTSSRSGELANDADHENSTSVFTSHLVKGLLAAAPDSDGDGYVGLSDVYDYVYERMTADHKQIPQRSFSGGGEISIARRALADLSQPGPIRPGLRGPNAVAVPPPAGPPVLELSIEAIDFGELSPGERPGAEPVFVVNRGGGRLDWVATSGDGWLTVETHDSYFTVTADPRPGPNRGKVVVFDRASGMTKAVHVSATREREREPAPVTPDPAPGPRIPAAPKPSGRRIGALVAVGVAVVAILIGVIVAVSGGGSGNGGDEPTRAGGRTPGDEVSDELDIPGAAGWIDTGIEVARGDRVLITAEGRVRHATNDMPGAVVGPDGDPTQIHHGNNVVDGFGHGGLVGRIGQGDPEGVGSAITFFAESDGRLSFRVNDYGIENNDGFFNVKVRVIYA